MSKLAQHKRITLEDHIEVGMVDEEDRELDSEMKKSMKGTNYSELDLQCRKPIVAINNRASTS